MLSLISYLIWVPENDIHLHVHLCHDLVFTLYCRMRGLLKTEVLPWHKRPVWYNVWEEFPPQELPDFQRELPPQTVKEILYPEDYVRA